MTTFSKDETIRGKWHKNLYQIDKKLGEGANGQVYLVRNSRQQQLALKVAEDTFTISSEVNVLKQLGQAQGGILGPDVIDVDDLIKQGTVFPFYVMRVVEGEELTAFVWKRKEWLPVLMIQLLQFLDELHRLGYVFGDMKPEHFRVEASPPRLAWLDAGGMTKLGRAVKEYTEWFDRGTWLMGNRKAEPSYDLFSLAMIFLHLETRQMPQTGEKPQQQLQEWVSHALNRSPYKSIIWSALTGKYQAAAQMQQAFLKAWRAEGTEVKDRQAHKQRPTQSQQTRKGQPPAQQPKRQPKRKVDKLINFFFFSSMMLFLFACYLVWIN